MTQPQKRENRDPLDIPTLSMIGVEDLALGMYIYKLDRPWTETPLMFQGFKVSNQDEIRTVREYCEFVFIDVARCDQDENLIHRLTSAAKKPEQAVDGQGRASPYPYITDIHEELGTARALYRESAKKIESLFESVRSGEAMNVSDVRETVGGIMESVLRNPDAFLLLRGLKNKDDYSFAHAIDACALATAFGRHIGFRKKDLNDIAMGALLLDIGKVKLPDELLSKHESLSDAEVKLIQRHVEYGVQILKETGNISPATIIMVASHHERFDGTGYPRGLREGAIPIYGRLAAIVDYYDAITSNRPHRKGISVHRAISELYRCRNTIFHEEMIEQFIQCLGVYPTGTLVELTTGEIAIVLSQNELRRLRPQVMVIMDAEKKPLENSQVINLMVQAEYGGQNRLEIERSVDPGEFDIDPADYYL